MRRVLVHPRRRRARRRRGHRARPGGPRRGRDAGPDVRPRARPSSSSRARPRRSPLCYEQSNTILEDGFDKQRRRARGPSDRHQQVGLVVPARAAPSSRSSSRSRPSAARRSPSSASTPATSARRRRSSSASARCPIPPTRIPTRRSPRSSKAAKFFPMTIFVDADGQDRLRQGRRVHLARRARGRHRQVPGERAARRPAHGSAGASSRRPAPTAPAATSTSTRRRRSTPPRTRSRPATRTRRRPRCTRCGPTAAGRTRRAGPSAWCRTSIPRSPQDAHEPEREANPDLYTAQPAAGHHEVIVNAPDVVNSLVELDARPARPSPWRPGASACARTPAARAGT